MRPRGLFDAHFHVIDPAYPLVASNGYLPAPFTVDDYLAVAEPLGFGGGAVVSGSFQGFDQTYLLAALRRLGPRFVGVTQLPADACDATIRELDAAGVRAVRCNLRRGGSVALDDLGALAQRVHEVAEWHVEVYVDARELTSLAPILRRLPRVVIDHLGLSAAGFADLLELVAGGARVKASGFGRTDLDVPTALRRVAEVDPGALLFGTDLPSTRAPRPFRPADVDLVLDTLGDDLARRALRDNAVDLYRPDEPPDRRAGGTPDGTGVADG